MMSGPYSMDDIDEYLNKIQEQQEIYEFIDKGIYPRRLQLKQVTKYIPPLDEDPIYYDDHCITNAIDDYCGSTIHVELDNMKHMLCKIEKEIQYTMERENSIINDAVTPPTINTDNKKGNDNCPVCVEHINERNYVVPNCGHKICINCFVTNFTLNHDKPCGKNCSLCREKIV
jgi:hypothetical protein